MKSEALDGTEILMNYKVNPTLFSAVFMVPSQIVDQHIKLAGGQQLKVCSGLSRHAGRRFDMEMCRDLNFQSRCAGLSSILGRDRYTVSDGNTKARICFCAHQTGEKEEPATQKKELPDIVPSRPTAAEIAQRAEESADIKFLLLETQNKLGRTIGYDGQCTLLMMHDTYGIPVEVILMIIEYAVSIGKSSFHYIASIGKDWGEREIDTIEKADEQISRLNSVNRVWASFAAMAGLSNSRPTQAQTKYIITWNREWGFSPEMIFLAYEQMAEHCQKMSFPYMNKVLESWHTNGIKTPSDVEKANKPVSSPNSPQNKSKANAGHASSYDLNEFNRNAMQKPIVYKKKNKD